MKVMTIIGTRPELIKLSRVIPELDCHTRHVLVHTGQNFDYELNGIFFDEMNIRTPDHFLGVAGENLGETLGNVLARSYQVLEAERPDALLLLGDTNSCLAAISAKRLKIPVFHMEAGNRCFEERVPEEINRRIVDHISDINLPYTEHARRYLLAEGLHPERIIKTGSPMKEIIEHYMPKIEGSEVLPRLELSPGSYFVVSAHREENVDSDRSLSSLLEALNTLAGKFQLPVIVSTHPRTRKRLEEIGVSCDDGQIRFLRPLGFFDYMTLQKNARCVLSDSGTITEESSILGFPAVTIRHAHERPEGMDEGTLIMCGLDAERIVEAVEVTASQRAAGRNHRVVADYDVDDVSTKIVRIILSYTEFVNRRVWMK